MSVAHHFLSEGQQSDPSSCQQIWDLSHLLYHTGVVWQDTCTGLGVAEVNHNHIWQPAGTLSAVASTNQMVLVCGKSAMLLSHKA